MIAAGIKVVVEATYRPPKRSYLMHWSWRIVNSGVDPASVPAMADVGIQWKHPSATASLQAANDMVDAQAQDYARFAVPAQSWTCYRYVLVLESNGLGEGCDGQDGSDQDDTP
jgi:hypothetical protein